MLREHPALIAYYRNVAVLSQKAVGYLAGIDVKRYENNKENRNLLTEQQALNLARLFNVHITLIIDSSIQSLTKDELQGLLLTSTGAQIEGSWRNTIGGEAEKVMQRLLVNEAKERQLLYALLPRVGTGAVVYDPAKLEEQLGQIERYRGIHLTNRASILFSSEPDITLVNNHSKTVGVIEVKGGADPAGALERYGAAKKSFNESRRTSSVIKTILVASCITREVQARIQQDESISEYFNLTEILSDQTAADHFMQSVFALLEPLTPS